MVRFAAAPLTPQNRHTYANQVTIETNLWSKHVVVVLFAVTLAILLHEFSVLEWLTTLRTKEVLGVPGTACCCHTTVGA